MINISIAPSRGEKLYSLTASILISHFKQKKIHYSFKKQINYNKNGSQRNYLIIEWIGLHDFQKELNYFKKSIINFNKLNLTLVTSQTQVYNYLKKQTNIEVQMITDLVNLNQLEIQYNTDILNNFKDSLFASGTSAPIKILNKNKKLRPRHLLRQEIQALQKKDIKTFEIVDEFDTQDSLSHLNDFLKSFPSLKWLYLFGLDEKIIYGSKLNLNNCLALAKKYHPSINVNISCPYINYIDLTKMSFMTGLTSIIKIVYSSSKIDHFYYYNERSLIKSFLCILGYFLLITNPLKFFFIITHTFTSKNNMIKLIHKLRRILS